MKYFSTSDVLKYTWEQVSCAIWNRYPNPYSSHVISEDTVLREVRNGCLITQRLITKNSQVPKFGELFMKGGNRKVCVLEESIVDPKAKTVTTYTTNIGLTNVVTVDEKCVYRPSGDDQCWTECQRQAWVTSNNFRLASALQSIVLKIFKKHIQKTIKGFEYTLNKASAVPESQVEQNKVFHLKTDKLLESKEKIKESAQKAKETAKELAKKSIVSH